MFNLYQVVTGAQGGRGLDNLAQQFGISREQADKAVQALTPALSTAFMTKARQPGGVSEIAGAMTDDHHRQAYADPETARQPITQEKGGDVASSIFGNSAIIEDVARKASQYTGVSAGTLERMLPVVLSMVMGGIATQMHNQGMGGLLGQLANSGFGGMLGNLAGGAQPGSAGQAGSAGQGGLGGILSGIAGGLFGGAANGPQQSAPSAGAASGPYGGGLYGGGLSPEMRAGMEALGRMFNPGAQASPAAQPEEVSDEIGSAPRDKKP